MKKTLDVEKSKSKIEKKITHPRGKRKRKNQVRQGSNRKQKIKKGHTRECAIFRRFQARTLREGCRTETKTILKNKHTHSATKDTREAKKRLADKKLKKKMKCSEKKQK